MTHASYSSPSETDPESEAQSAVTHDQASEVTQETEVTPENSVSQEGLLKAVSAFLPLEGDQTTDLMASLITDALEVEKSLIESVGNTDALADVTTRYLIEAGGKRVRPILALLAAHLGNGVDPDVIKAAVIVELTHLATLYHDDVMDSAPLRRGGPSANEVWGNTVAILTGDLIFARAAILGAQLGAQVIRAQAETFERLCLGQLHETMEPGLGQDPVEHYLSVISDKTGSLVSNALELGALAAKVSPSFIEALKSYGEKIGVAFQIADDIIDLAGDPQSSGKIKGNDLREKVQSYPVLLTRRQAAEGDVAAQKMVELLESDLSFDEALAHAVDYMNQLDVIDQSRTDAIGWAEQAVEALVLIPEGAVREALEAFAYGVSKRIV